MAIRYAVQNGNWSDPLTWDGQTTIPTSSDDVRSNTFTVQVDGNYTVLTVSNKSETSPPISGGGTFSLTNGSILQTTAATGILGAAANTGAVTFSLPAGQSASIISRIACAVTPLTNAWSVYVAGTGTLNVTGDIYAGTASGSDFKYGINISAAAIVNYSGTAQPGTWVSDHAINVGTSGVTLNATGTFIGTSGQGGRISFAVNVVSGSTANITGECRGGGAGSAVNNAGTGTINITGQCNGSNTGGGSAFVNSSSGLITHVGIAQASSTAPAIGIGSATQRTILTGPLLCSPDNDIGAAAAGVNPCAALRWFPKETELNTFIYRMKDEAVVSSARADRDLFLIEQFEATYPAPSDVRAPISYGPDDLYTGTMAVPPAESVIFGVPVDDTVGTAIPDIDAADIWDFPASTSFAPGSMGERLSQLATVGSVGDQIAAMKQASD